VNEVEKEYAIFTQGLMNEAQKKNAELTQALDLLVQAYDDTIEALGSALDLKDAETAGHSQRVTAYTISIAKSVPVPLQYLSVLARAAFLHDIGKMATPKRWSCAPIVKLATTCSRAFRFCATLRRSSSPTMSSSMAAAILAVARRTNPSWVPDHLHRQYSRCHAERLALSQCAFPVSSARGNSPLCRHAIGSQNCGGVSLYSRKPLDRASRKPGLTLPAHTLEEYGVCFAVVPSNPHERLTPLPRLLGSRAVQ
jgi:hypothetical protein